MRLVAKSGLTFYRKGCERPKGFLHKLVVDFLERSIFSFEILNSLLEVSRAETMASRAMISSSKALFELFRAVLWLFKASVRSAFSFRRRAKREFWMCCIGRPG